MLFSFMHNIGLIHAYSIKQFSAFLPELEADILKIRGIKKGVSFRLNCLFSSWVSGKTLATNKYTKIHAPWREPSANSFSLRIVFQT